MIGVGDASLCELAVEGPPLTPSSGPEPIAAETLRLRRTVSQPGSGPGAYYVIAQADADGTVVETSENDNATARAITIGPDLAVSSFSVTGS
jgi:hypothetical protein